MDINTSFEEDLQTKWHQFKIVPLSINDPNSKKTFLKVF
jgi:hypothetical protein